MAGRCSERITVEEVEDEDEEEAEAEGSCGVLLFCFRLLGISDSTSGTEEAEDNSSMECTAPKRGAEKRRIKNERMSIEFQEMGKMSSWLT